MDPLSISAGILAILDTTSKVIKYGLDFAAAPKEIRVLKENFETLESLLTRLMVRCESAQHSQLDDEPQWLRGLWEVRSKHFDKDGRWIFEYKGMVAQLKNVIEEMAVKLNPSREWKRSEAYQRSTWHFKKDTFTEMHTTITRCCAAINTILALNNDETLNATLDLMRDNSEYSKTQLASIDNRLSMFEINQKREKEEEEREEIVNWLSPLSFIAKQDELWANCYQATGEWLWQDKRFQVWSEGRPWFLQCVGAQGVGKTVLSSILTRHLPSHSSQRRVPVLSIYLNYNSSNIQTLPHLVGSLLKQLIQLDESYIIPEELKTVHKKAKRLRSESTSYFSNIRRILLGELDRYDRFYLLVDGFDELPPRDRVALQKELLSLRPEKGSLLMMTRKISEQSRGGTYECNRCHSTGLDMAFRCEICDKGDYDLCYSCKPQGCLVPSHNLSEPYGYVELTVKIPPTDIENYVKWEIGSEINGNKAISHDDRDTAVTDNPFSTPFQDLCQSDPNLPEQIAAEITQRANGRFLIARLYMDSLKRQTNVRGLKRTLRNFPDQLDGIYRDAMLRIQAQEPEERKRAFRILGLVSHARRPLGLKELQHALAVMDFQDGEGNTEADILDAIDQPKTILGCTSALVVSEEMGTQVRLVHRSLEDYLHHEENCSKWLPDAATGIARVCMTYLDLVLPRKVCRDEYYNARNSHFPFLQYASQYWGDHVRIASADTEVAADLQAAALRLMDDPQRMDACMQAAWVTNPGGHDSWDVWRNLNKLHISAWYGLDSIFAEMDPENSLVDMKEPKYGQTPLMYACRKGHHTVARQLLLQSASQREASARGRTALFEAILGHHTGNNSRASKGFSKHCKVVELLVCELPRDLQINQIDIQEYDRTALMLATRLGNLDMVLILLKHQDISVNIQDINGMTALYIAAREDHYEIAQLLLDAEAGIDIADFHAGRTPLRCAAERNHSDMVDLLLQYGADPTIKDREGGTAMLRAVNRGAKEALLTMMEYPINIECTDEDGQSLLHGAAKNGYHEIARLLMEILAEDRLPVVKSLAPDIKDNHGRTPLHHASQQGHAAVVSVLLEKRADASVEDAFQRTPFKVAWQYGHNNIMNMLSDAGYGQRSNEGFDEKCLPLWSMARRGLTDLVAGTLKTQTQHVHALEPCTNNSPLHCAIEANEPDVFYMLLKTEMFPVNQQNHFGRTPLHLAALVGDILCLKFLIDHHANADLKDRWEDEALFLAQSNQHLATMLALIEAHAKVDRQKIDTKQLFFFAVEEGNVSSARILIEEHEVDRSLQNADGIRPLQIAIAADDEEMVKLLRAASTVNYSGVPTNNHGPGDPEYRKMKFSPFRSRPMQLEC